MLDYADNPDKTTPQRYLDSDLYDTLKYAANDAKTDRTMFVGGINCSKQNAYGEMVAVQKRFGNRGSVVAYHGIQSFRAGEVTPEMAFEIGKETARRMWGDRYQVLVTVHLNTENVHCHFVVNPVSFLSPLIVRPLEGTDGYEVISGHRRLHAAQKERLKIPMERIRKFFPKSYTPNQIEEAVVKLCENNYRRRTEQER